MILKGSQRSGAKQLADHLMNDRDNDHVRVLELRDFVADDLHGAFAEAHAVAKATRCKQFLFSLSLNPPKDHSAGEQDFVAAADKAEAKLGLMGQPRAIVIHEKEGRRHAHVVWSRIDASELKAINLPFFKDRLTALSKELYLEHGWTLPNGLKAGGGKSPLNFTQAEWQQAQRQNLDPREIKAVFREAWASSDSLKGFGNALAERGYFIACGDRRGFVAVDVQGEIYALSRWLGLKAKDVRAKLGDPKQLESTELQPVPKVRDAVKAQVTQQLRGFIRDAKTRQLNALKPLQDEKKQLVAEQRRERQGLAQKQDQRWQAEAKSRADRLRSGMRGLLDRVIGKRRKTVEKNDIEALKALERDRTQRDSLAMAQLKDRQELQERFHAVRTTQSRERKLLARDVTAFLRNAMRRSESAERSNERQREAERPSTAENRDRGPRFSL